MVSFFIWCKKTILKEKVLYSVAFLSQSAAEIICFKIILERFIQGKQITLNFTKIWRSSYPYK